MGNWKWYVYILECKDGSYYVGRTWNLGDRGEQHLSKLGSKYTAKHGVKRLAYAEEFNNFEEACLREKQLKGWTRRKKEKLINGEWGKWV